MGSPSEAGRPQSLSCQNCLQHPIFVHVYPWIPLSSHSQFVALLHFTGFFSSLLVPE